MYIVAYVDDLLDPENDADVKVAKQQFAKRVFVADLRQCHFLLGVK